MRILKFYPVIFSCVLVCLTLGGCGNSEKDAVKEFALVFGRWVVHGDFDYVAEVYPDADFSKIPELNFIESKVQIFPEGDHRYKIKYGNEASVDVKVGLDNAIEVVSSQGIFTEEAIVEEPDGIQAVEEETVEVIDESAKKDFAAKFKRNIKADSEWQDAGWNDRDNAGTCYLYVRNNNSFPVDASDYYITYKYEYLYEGGADMYSENCHQNGKTLSANGKAKFTHHYTDDCGPLKVKIHFNLNDDQIYEKYGR